MTCAVCFCVSKSSCQIQAYARSSKFTISNTRLTAHPHLYYHRARTRCQLSTYTRTQTAPPKIDVERIHGIGSPTRMSKILLPTEDDMAMSPCPCCATITLESASGSDRARDVPKRGRIKSQVRAHGEQTASRLTSEPRANYERDDTHLESRYRQPGW